MKIVVLDGHTLNPGDLSWSGLEELGEVVVYERSSPEEVEARSKDCDALITNKAIVSEKTILGASSLKYIGVLATGVNIVDTEAAARKGVPVCNVVGYGPESVAQMVFAHILNFTHRLAAHAQDAQSGGWAKCPDFCYWKQPLLEISGLTLGIVGLGEIGSAVARIGRGFGLNVIAYTRNPDRPEPEGVAWVGLDELFSRSDFISLHCPLTPDTQNLVDADRIDSMKPNAFIVNTGRGPLVDEKALAAALNSGWIAGAGLDVLSSEPPSSDNPLLSAKNCAVTPHIAWATQAARARLMKMSVENLKSFIEGKTINRVN